MRRAEARRRAHGLQAPGPQRHRGDEGDLPARPLHPGPHPLHVRQPGDRRRRRGGGRGRVPAQERRP